MSDKRTPKVDRAKPYLKPNRMKGIQINEPKVYRPKVTLMTVQKGDQYGAPINDEFMLTVDLGYLSPISDVPISSPEQTPSPTIELHEETPSKIAQDSLKMLLQPNAQDSGSASSGDSQNNGKQENETQARTKERSEDQTFKRQLNKWLIENKFCLVPTKCISENGVNGQEARGKLTIHESSFLEH